MVGSKLYKKGGSTYCGTSYTNNSVKYCLCLFRSTQRMQDIRKHVSTRWVDSAQGTFCNAEFSIKRPSQGKTRTGGFKRERNYQKFSGILPKILKSCPSQNQTSYLVNCSIINSLTLKTKHKTQRWSSYGYTVNFV